MIKSNVVISLSELALDWKNPLGKDIFGSWLYHKVSWTLLSDVWSYEEVQKGLMQHGDTAPVLKTSALLLSDP